MTPEEIRAARERCDKATSGPWNLGKDVDGELCRVETIDYGYGPGGIAETGEEVDAEFIAHARTDLPAALIEIERLQKELADLRQVTESFKLTPLPDDRRKMYKETL